MQITIYNMPKEIRVEDVIKAYTGKPNTCMCGCAGVYVTPKINQEKATKDRGYAVSDDEINDNRVSKIIQNLFKNAANGIEVQEAMEDGLILTTIIGKTQYTLYTV